MTDVHCVPHAQDAVRDSRCTTDLSCIAVFGAALSAGLWTVTPHALFCRGGGHGEERGKPLFFYRVLRSVLGLGTEIAGDEGWGGGVCGASAWLLHWFWISVRRALCSICSMCVVCAVSAQCVCVCCVCSICSMCVCVLYSAATVCLWLRQHLCVCSCGSTCVFAVAAAPVCLQLQQHLCCGSPPPPHWPLPPYDISSPGLFLSPTQTDLPRLLKKRWRGIISSTNPLLQD